MSQILAAFIGGNVVKDEKNQDKVQGSIGGAAALGVVLLLSGTAGFLI